MGKEVRMGVIGIGGMGGYHAGYLKEGKVDGARLAAVCDTDTAKFAQFPGVKTFEDSGKLIRSGEVDAVLIATPHYFHTTIGIDALQNGIHVLTEKPISVHKKDCERLIAAHKGTKLVFSAMFQMRTGVLWQKVRKLLQAAELGELHRITWILTDWFRSEAYYASGGWRATWKGEGGGVLTNQCPHNLDLMQWFVGMPKTVYARVALGKYHDIEVEDDVTALLEYPNGATGLFMTTTGEAPGTNRLEIDGERGKLVVENWTIKFHRTEVPVSEFRKTSRESFGAPATWEIDIPASGGGHHHLITQNFVNAIREGEELVVRGEEGINAVELANSMMYSSFTGAPVNLPLDADAYEAKLKELVANSRFQKKEVRPAKVDMKASFK